MLRRLSVTSGLISILFLMVCAQAGDDNAAMALRCNWPGFRGYGATGVCSDRQAPTEWDGETGKNVAWKTEVPLPGTNSPVVWKDRIFLTGATEKQRTVFCFDAKTGTLRWRHEVDNVPDSPTKVPEVSESAGFASSTLACDGERVFGIFANGDLVCCDLSGKRVWAKSLGMPNIDYGYVASPLAYNGLLYVQFDEIAKGRLFAFDAKTGTPKWVANREVKDSWSSPILAETTEGPQIVLNGRPFVVGYDPATGVERWSEKCMRGELTPSPAFAHDITVFAQEYATCVAVNAVTSKLAWEQLDIDLPDVASPVAFGEYAIIPTSIGIVYCVSLKDGKVRWEQEYDEGFYASPVVVDDAVYLLDMEGQMQIINAAPTYQLIAAPKLGEKTIATPAFVANRIYIRAEKNLYCIANQSE